MTDPLLTNFIGTILLCAIIRAQEKFGSFNSLQPLPVRFIKYIDKVFSQFDSRVCDKSEKSHIKLHRGQDKINPLRHKYFPKLLMLNSRRIKSGLQLYDKMIGNHQKGFGHEGDGSFCFIYCKINKQSCSGE